MKSKSSHIYYYMIIPAVVLFFTFHTYPALQGIFYSFTNSKGYGTYNFVGLKNYRGDLYASYMAWFRTADPC